VGFLYGQKRDPVSCEERRLFPDAGHGGGFASTENRKGIQAGEAERANHARIFGMGQRRIVVFTGALQDRQERIKTITIHFSTDTPF